jgi:hypothetical protein
MCLINTLLLRLNETLCSFYYYSDTYLVMLKTLMMLHFEILLWFITTNNVTLKTRHSTLLRFKQECKYDLQLIMLISSNMYCLFTKDFEEDFCAIC